jgi:hypothetical protein
MCIQQRDDGCHTGDGGEYKGQDDWPRPYRGFVLNHDATPKPAALLAHSFRLAAIAESACR